MCFASTTKGLTAIAIQSFTTANTLGVLDQLQLHLKEYSPKTGELAAKGLMGMPPKAYRYVMFSLNLFLSVLSFETCLGNFWLLRLVSQLT